MSKKPSKEATGWRHNPLELWDNTGMVESVYVSMWLLSANYLIFWGHYVPINLQKTYRFPALVNTSVSPKFGRSERFSEQGNQSSLFVSVVLSDVTVLSGLRLLVQKWDLFCF